MLGDLEAGLGTVLRLDEGGADLAIVVAQPSAKALEVARRALNILAARKIPAVLIANRVTGEADLDLILEELNPQVPVVPVPDDRAVARADEEGLAAIDAAPDSAAVAAILTLLDRIPPAGT